MDSRGSSTSRRPLRDDLLCTARDRMLGSFHVAQAEKATCPPSPLPASFSPSHPRRALQRAHAATSVSSLSAAGRGRGTSGPQVDLQRAAAGPGTLAFQSSPCEETRQRDVA